MFGRIQLERDTERSSQSRQPVEYASAVWLRAQAEAAANPRDYERAAAELEALGMSHAAERCRERASHYRG